jgi:hypothetical protein
MLRVALVAAVVLFPAYALSDAGGGTSPAAAAKTRLHVVTLRPLAVLGTGFHAGESVRVTVRTDAGAGARSDEAGAAGRIGVRFPRLKLGRCPTYVISARGDEGSRATLRSVPRPCGIDR